MVKELKLINKTEEIQLKRVNYYYRIKNAKRSSQKWRQILLTLVNTLNAKSAYLEKRDYAMDDRDRFYRLLKLQSR